MRAVFPALLRAFGLPVLLVIGIGVGLLPWTVRNYQVHQKLIFIKDSMPYVFWQGNNPKSQGTDKLLVNGDDAESLLHSWLPWRANRRAFDVRSKALSVDVHLEPEFIQQLQSLPTERQRMELFAERIGREFSWSNYVRLCWRRFTYWIWFDATNPRCYLWHYRVMYLLMVGCALPAIACGIASLLRADVGQWMPVVLCGISLTAVHVLIITSARFRIPMEMLLVLPAAISVHAAAVWVQNRIVIGDRKPLRSLTPFVETS